MSELKTKNKKHCTIPKNWHHDIQYIDDEYIEKAIEKYQQTGDETIINKIIDNYAIYKGQWGKDLAAFYYGDQDDGELIHDIIVWKAAKQFDVKKVSKPDGKAFNAYLVSALLNQIKNSKNFSTSRKNHPRIKCPICNEEVYQIDANHLMHRYTIKKYVEIYENLPIFSYDGKAYSPVSGKLILGFSFNKFDQNNNYIQQVPVYDPYSQKHVAELTPLILKMYGTTVSEHLIKYATIAPNCKYKKLFINPFTGEKTKIITTDYLAQIGKSAIDLAYATCEFPLKKFQVKCEICKKYVNNIWSHLKNVEHNYATKMHFDEFLSIYGPNSTKKVINNNSYVENDSGDIHISDLFPQNMKELNALEIYDSLIIVAKDDLDKSIINSIITAHNVSDIFFLSSTKTRVELPFNYGSSRIKEIRQIIKNQFKINDFDILKDINKNPKYVLVLSPGKQTIKKRIKRLFKESDINK